MPSSMASCTPSDQGHFEKEETVRDFTHAQMLPDLACRRWHLNAWNEVCDINNPRSSRKQFFLLKLPVATNHAMQLHLH